MLPCNVGGPFFVPAILGLHGGHSRLNIPKQEKQLPSQHVEETAHLLFCNARIFLLRTIAALVLDMAAKRLPHSGPGTSDSAEQWELPELMDALEKTFQQTYDAQVGSVSSNSGAEWIYHRSLKVCVNNVHPTPKTDCVSLMTVIYCIFLIGYRFRLQQFETTDW